MPGDGDAGVDAGLADAGEADSGASDAGLADAGEADSGAWDAGAPDASGCPFAAPVTTARRGLPSANGEAETFRMTRAPWLASSSMGSRS
jgi:hypothetical protein